MGSLRSIGALAILAIVVIPANCKFNIIEKTEKFKIETLELTTFRSNPERNQGKSLAAQHNKDKYEEQPKDIFDTLDVETVPSADVQRKKPIPNTIARSDEGSANAQSIQNQYQEKLLQDIVDSLRSTAPPAKPIAEIQKQEQFELYQEQLLQELLVDYKGDVNCSCAGFTCICCTELAYQNLRTNYCTSMTYKPEISKVAVALLLDNNVIHSKDISLVFPSPLCIELAPSPIHACARYYVRVLPIKNTIEMCVDGDFFLPDRSALDVHFNCVIMGPPDNFREEIMENPHEKSDVISPTEKPSEKQEAHDEKSDGKDKHADNIPDQIMSNDVVNVPHLERHRRSITSKWR